MRHIILAIVILLFTNKISASSNTVVDLKSRFNLQETATRYIAALQAADISIKDDLTKQSPNLKNKNTKIQFSHPFYGTIIGKCGKGSYKDQPFETRIWEDNQGDVWLRYEQPTPLINQFGVIECGFETDAVIRSLSGFASTATQP